MTTRALSCLALVPLWLQGCHVWEEVSSRTESILGDLPLQGRQKSETTTLAPAPQVQQAQPTSLRTASEGLPLSVGTWYGGPRLLVDVAPQNSEGAWFPAQRLVLDTGSSTLAFCNSQFIQDAQYKPSQYISCNQYNPGGSFTGYFGPFVTGDVQVGSVSMPQSHYSIMQEEREMPCTHGLQGIFGIAFRQLDVAFLQSDEVEMEITEQSFTCPKQSAGVVAPPLVHHLRSGQSAKLGIYWSGQQGEAQGRLYLGSSAVENQHYSASAAQVAQLGEQGWYDIKVQSITVGGQILEDLNCDPVNGQTCIMDTGTPSLVLPQEAFDLYQNAMGGSLSLQLAGPDGPVAMSFDVAKLTQMGAVSKGNKDDGIILGLPLWAFYYTVFDLDAYEVEFIPNFPPAANPEVYPTEEPVWQPEPIEPTGPVIPFPGEEPWRPIPGGAGDIVGPYPFGWPIGFKQENGTAEDHGRRLLPVHI